MNKTGGELFICFACCFDTLPCSYEAISSIIHDAAVLNEGFFADKKRHYIFHKRKCNDR